MPRPSGRAGVIRFHQSRSEIGIIGVAGRRRSAVSTACIKRTPLDVEPYQLSFRRLSKDRSTFTESKGPSAAIVGGQRQLLVEWRR
jgi:hypothetical protein